MTTSNDRAASRFGIPSLSTIKSDHISEAILRTLMDDLKRPQGVLPMNLVVVIGDHNYLMRECVAELEAGRRA